MDRDKIFDISVLWNRYNNALKTSDWIDKIPFINFPSEWQVQPIPNFGWAMARFRVRKWEKTISIYLDCYDVLWIMWKAYWEVYPALNCDTERCDMDDIDTLLDIIQKSLDEKK